MDKYICIHGHFYQPPRENPWLEEIELQESAHPYHDWNERITAECYAPNSASRILGTDESIIDIVNNYAKINFNFGPTLLSWLERRQPEVYQAILEADRISAKRYSGHGSAMAQIYNHMIMPLANRRDKLTQTRWGIKDFVRRFERYPEGMWLPETAVDLETLEVLAEFGILFTILSPHQAGRVKAISEGEWKKVKEGEIDPSMPYLCKLPSGKSIHIFFYDGPISREVAFGNLLSSGDLFASKLSGAFREERNRPQIVHIATDGETFGHHQPHADMALAYTLFTIESKNIAKLTNYGEYLAKNPPSHMIEIIEKSSWSCSHGVERWRSNCGCNIGKFPGGKQPWRAPLREGMDWLRDQAAAIYEEGVSDTLRNPWEARDEYIEVIAHRSRVDGERFLRRHQIRMLDDAEMSRTLRLLEMQRYAMLMYTSCGWFFDDISGIESVQIMQYACRVIQLAEEINSIALEPKFLEYLRNAPSLLEGDGGVIYEKFVKPSRIDLKKAGAHHALLSLFDPHQEHSKFYFYSLHNHEKRSSALGRLRWVTGMCRVSSELTWEEEDIGYSILDLGGHHLICGVTSSVEESYFSDVCIEIEASFARGDLSEASRLLYHFFGKNNYSIFNLFKDDQKKILNSILKRSYEGFASLYGQIHKETIPMVSLLKNLQISLPRPFLAAQEYLINVALRKALQPREADFVHLESLIQEIKQWPGELDKPEIELLATERVEGDLKRLSVHPDGVQLLDATDKLLKILNPLHLKLNLWKSQNLYYSIGKKMMPKMEKRSRDGEALAKRWIKSFKQLGRSLRVKIF